MLVCFDFELLISSIAVFHCIRGVIRISRESAQSLQSSISTVGAKELYFKMAQKAVRLGFENCIFDFLLIFDIGQNMFEIVYNQNESKTYTNIFGFNEASRGGIPNMHVLQLLLLYLIQYSAIIYLIDYMWISNDYVSYQTNVQNKQKVRELAKQRYQQKVSSSLPWTPSQSSPRSPRSSQ